MAGIEGLKASNTLVAQIITVSAGLLAFTVTFVEKFTPEGAQITAPIPLKMCWVALALTILFGFWTLMATTGTLTEIDAGRQESNPERWNIRIPGILMLLAFLSSITLLIIAGWTITG
ncbi:MAG TPA: hypothetical protein VHG92_06795 [Afifellaceae bacterium]|nr:hypothetical protein [Afifellaceae bacterium]